MGDAKIAARLQYTIRSKTGAQTLWGPPDVKPAEGFQSTEAARTFEYSKDGNLLAVIAPENVLVFNSLTGQVAQTIPRPNVAVVAFSPQASFIVTWERLEEKTNGNENNLIVWRIDTAEPIIKFTQKVFSADLWPSLSWTKDESYFARIVKTEVHFYAAKSVRSLEIVRRLQLANVARVEFSPAEKAPYHLAVFVPEAKSQPGSVRIYAVPPSHSNDAIRSTASKTFFRGTEASLMWNSTGTALLASLATDVDVTGKSYYGETGLYFLTTDASFECMIQLQKEGPIHDVRWSPTGKEFVVIYGFMPSPQTTLFDVKCNPVVDFGTASRNTIRWSPDGKLLCIGGFGNLTGQMDFWDVKSATKVGTAIAHCAAVTDWAPDSRHFIAAVVSPRIRVDNGYKIFKYNGTLVHEAAVHELYQVGWRPRNLALYPERPLTPTKPGGAPGSPSPAQSKPAAAPAAAPAKYRHPHAMEAAPRPVSQDEGVKRYKAPGTGGEKSQPPGWFDDDEEKKKKKDKKKKNTNANTSENQGGNQDSANLSKNQRKKQKAAAQAAAAAEGIEAISISSPPPSTTTTTTTTTAPSPSPSSSSPALSSSSPASPSPASSKKAAAQSPKPQHPRKAPNKQ